MSTSAIDATVVVSTSPETHDPVDDQGDVDKRSPAQDESTVQPARVNHVLYKRRFIGLLHLALLNLVVSWCWLTFAASSTTTAQYFRTSQSNVNWLSTGFLFAFVAETSYFTLGRSKSILNVVNDLFSPL